MRNTITMLGVATAIAAGAGVLMLKLTVKEKQEYLQALTQQIQDDQEAMRVMRAEWAYLTSPSKLQDKSVRFLALMPPSPKQVISDPTQIPLRPKGEEAEEDPGVLLPTSFSAKKEDEKTKPKSRKDETL